VPAREKAILTSGCLIGSERPPSPFDKLRVRTTVGVVPHKILILSLSKDEDCHPL
jgi:hypothetical protein